MPTHWEVRRLKRVASLNPSKTESRTLLTADMPVTFLPMERVGTDGKIDEEVVPASSVWNGFTYFRRDDVLVAKITPCFENGKGACLESLSTEIGFGSTEFHVLRSRASILPQFLYRLTTLAEFRHSGAEEMTGAAGQQRVPQGFMANYPLPLPPLPEQTAIIRYLDYTDRRIRRYISSRERLIELLEEYRQAVIHHAVTRGLDPDVHLKPSGVEWLGDVPAHWEVRKLKTLSTRVQNGSTPSTEEPSYYAKDGLPWYSPPSLDRSIVVGHPTRYLSDRAIEEGKARPIAPPALAVSVIGNVGKCALMLQPGATNQQITCFGLITNFCNPHFVIMQFRFAEESLIASASSATIAILDSGVLKATKLAIPPLSEQTAIVAYLDKATADIDAAIDRARREIELLGEYRTRLIADVVTGKVDVREAVAGLSAV